MKCPMCQDDDFGRVKGHKTKVFCRTCGWQHINGDGAIKPRAGRPKDLEAKGSQATKPTESGGAAGNK